MSTASRPARRLLDLSFSRVLAREVAIGNLRIGARRPVAIQSMTTTSTADAAATAEQVCSLARAGCQIVRVTVPSSPDARALPEIRRIMRTEGIDVPLVADIHFSPRIAMQVVEQVEKVRINPGNFSDRRSLAGEIYDERRWEEDRERARAQFLPLVRRARELGVALRIGVNHGSLSDRLVQRYGDSPEGMVESALEFIEFAEDAGHRELVISIKASIPQVMVRAYRLLARRLGERGELYPLHLGVTEAGGGDDGRVKSAAGIATLLGEGLGDTVRVSLTEDPLAEIPVARELVRLFARPNTVGQAGDTVELGETRDPLDPIRRAAAVVEVGSVGCGGDHPPMVELSLPVSGLDAVETLARLQPAPDLLDFHVSTREEIEAVAAAAAGAPLPLALTVSGSARRLLLESRDLRATTIAGLARVGLRLDPSDDPRALRCLFERTPLALIHRPETPFGPRSAEGVLRFAERLAGAGEGLIAGIEPATMADLVPAGRVLAAALDRCGCRVPILLVAGEGPGEDPRLGLAGRASALLLDGLGDAIQVAGNDPEAMSDLAHRILQACRRRLERAEFIACPSCGRTLFDLEQTTRTVQDLTGHLKLKIAVMGCVVNGPGEMADADYGYVGWGEGKVALFAGREMVERDIPSAQAPQRLVDLIRSRGDWTDPPEPEPAH